MLTVRTLQEAQDLVRSLARICAGSYRADCSRPILGQGKSSPPCIGPVTEAPLDEALGCVLAADLTARIDVPSFDRSTVDGYAVRAADTFGAGENLPALLPCLGEIRMGRPADQIVLPGTCQAIPTGGQLPPGADAVVMLEDCELIEPDLCCVGRAVAPGTHVILRGDDARAGQRLMPAGRSLLAQDLAALAACGYGSVPVFGRAPPLGNREGQPVGSAGLLRVGVLSTGDELVDAGQSLLPGQIHDVNAVMIRALVRQTGAVPIWSERVNDERDQIAAAVADACRRCDVVVLSGGSSAGSRDHVASAIAAAGQPGILLHGLAVKPGKPTVIGLVDRVPVIGLPGHPLAAWFMARLLLQPLLFDLLGCPGPVLPTVTVPLSRRLPSNHGREELVPVRLIDADGPAAEPILTKSGLITVLSRCQGTIHVARDCEGLPAGSLVTVQLLREG
jgi:molybdopterin molybdotransferase